jgi:catechol 2,3-dioxygenase-like lactoylglutathione lyase family enzyme
MMAVLVGGFGYVDHITLNVTDIEAATEAFKKLGMTVDGSLDADGW